MKGAYRSSSRLVMDLLAALKDEGPANVTRLLLVANLTHGKLQELLNSFEENGWAIAVRASERSQWVLTEKGLRVLADLRRVDAVMQDHGLGL
jgi:predicted transcriptional regulator